MEIFKGSSRKGMATLAFGKDGKNLILGYGDIGCLAMGLYYDDCEKDFNIMEDFLVEKGDNFAYKELDNVFFSYGGNVFFATEGAGVALTKEDKGYHFYFDRTFNENNKIIEASFLDDTMENISLMNFFKRMQKYEPENKQDSNDIKTLQRK